eukprot:66480-Pelagomonas_calceolata.AAC.1
MGSGVTKLGDDAEARRLGFNKWDRALKRNVGAVPHNASAVQNFSSHLTCAGGVQAHAHAAHTASKQQTGLLRETASLEAAGRLTKGGRLSGGSRQAYKGR